MYIWSEKKNKQITTRHQNSNIQKKKLAKLIQKHLARITFEHAEKYTELKKSTYLQYLELKIKY